MVWPLLGLAPIGLLLGAVALATRDRSVRYKVGLVALAVAFVASSLGVFGAYTLRSSGKAAASLVESQTQKARVVRASVIEARLPLRLGLGVAMIPMLGGLTGVFSSMRLRRWGSGPLSRRAPSTKRGAPLSRLGGAPVGNRVVAIGAGAIAGLGVFGAAGVLLMPPPPPNLAIESPVWAALEGVEQMENGSQSGGCQLIEDAAGKGRIEPARFPEVSSAVSTCFDLRFDEALNADPRAVPGLLDALAHSALPYSAADRARLEREIKRAASTPPSEAL